MLDTSIGSKMDFVYSQDKSEQVNDIQRRLNIDASSWCCSDVQATLCRRHVSAGVIIVGYLKQK